MNPDDDLDLRTLAEDQIPDKKTWSDNDELVTTFAGEELSRKEVERGKGRTVDEVYAEWEAEAKARADNERQQAEQQAAQRDAELEGIKSWSPQEREAIGQLEEANKQLGIKKHAFMAASKVLDQRLAEIEKSDPNLARQLVVARAVKAQELAAAEAQITQMANQWRQSAGIKSIASDYARLRDEIPELSDNTTRQDFVRWAARKHGITVKQAESVTDPALVRREWQAYAAEKASAEVRSKLSEIHRGQPSWGPLADQGHDTPTSIQEQRDRLKRTGKIEDALALMKIGGVKL